MLKKFVLSHLPFTAVKGLDEMIINGYTLFSKKNSFHGCALSPFAITEQR